MVAVELGEDLEVLADRVGGALEPGLDLRRLLGGQDLDVAAGEGVETVGAADVPVQRHRVELGQHVHPFHAGVDGVGDRDVDQAVLAGDRHRRFAAHHGQGRQPLAAPAAEDQHRHVVTALVENAHRLPLDHVPLQCSPSPLPAKGRRISASQNGHAQAAATHRNRESRGPSRRILRARKRDIREGSPANEVITLRLSAGRRSTANRSRVTAVG